MKNLKIVKLQGGVGNQMFQYAFGKGLEYKLNCKVLFDKTDYDNWQSRIIADGKDCNGVRVREYELGIYNTDIKFATEEQIKKCIGNERTVKSIFPGFIRKKFNIPKYKTISNRFVEKCYCEIESEMFVDNKNIYYEGYFQNENYFKDIAPFIKKIFTLPPIRENDTYNKKLFDKVNNYENSVFIHVRRDDYINLNCEINLTYYKKAVNYILERIENPKFFVFCAEDVNYIRNKFDIGYDFELIGEENKTHKTFYENMRLMKACKHSILANSSYSWWAAWLSDYKGKIVIAPTPWLADKDQIICQHWIKIKK